MKLASEFIRLPYHFDVDKLTEEVLKFERSEWLPHVQRFTGNSSIPLISLNGEMNDNFNGPMRATKQLRRSPYIEQVLASFGEVFGRSRLMGLDTNCSVPEHRDVNYHWYSRVRIHIPIITNPAVSFYCGDAQVHMAAGETWIFDSWKKHRVENRSDQFRVHLVVDTSGSANFWNVVAKSEWRGVEPNRRTAALDDEFLAYEKNRNVEILTENFNAPLVMNPGELDALVVDIVDDMLAHDGNSPQTVSTFADTAQSFRWEWRRLWSLYGQTKEGWPHYENLIKSVHLPRSKILLASNEGSATHTFSQRILVAALSPSLADNNSLI